MSLAVSACVRQTSRCGKTRSHLRGYVKKVRKKSQEKSHNAIIVSNTKLKNTVQQHRFRQWDNPSKYAVNTFATFKSILFIYLFIYRTSHSNKRSMIHDIGPKY